MKFCFKKIRNGEAALQSVTEETIDLLRSHEIITLQDHEYANGGYQYRKSSFQFHLSIYFWDRFF